MIANIYFNGLQFTNSRSGFVLKPSVTEFSKAWAVPTNRGLALKPPEPPRLLTTPRHRLVSGFKPTLVIRAVWAMNDNVVVSSHRLAATQDHDGIVC